MDIKLECRSLCFAYGEKPVLNGISFSVRPGTFCALLGRNGSGKSTLLHCCNRILKPFAGQILINGTDTGRLSQKAIAARVSLVPQEHMDIFPFTVLDLVVMGRAPHLGMASNPGPKDYQMARRTLADLKAEPLADCNFNRISGGERQIALLTGALVQSSEVLLLDEPTNHLDFNNQYLLLSRIKQICRDRGTGVVAAMHDPNLAMLFADQVVMIQNGTVLAAGEADAVMRRENLDRLYEAETVRIELSGGKRVFLPKSVMDE